MEKIDEIAQGCVREALDDYVELWQIATRVRCAFASSTNEQTKRLGLKVVRLIAQRGLHPGDYSKAGFRFWDESDADAIVARIDREWDPARGDPTLAKPICWFAMKQADASCPADSTKPADMK